MSTVSFRMRIAKNSHGTVKHYEVYGKGEVVPSYVKDTVCCTSASSKGLAADILKRDPELEVVKKKLEGEGFRVTILF